MNLDKIFALPHRIVFSAESASTHSRTNDSLAVHLRQNLETAFAVGRVAPLMTAKAPANPASRLEMAPNATPYKLTISAFFPRPALPLSAPYPPAVKLDQLLEDRKP